MQVAVDIIDTLIESLSEGLMTDSGLTSKDIDAMQAQIEALEYAKQEILAAMEE